MGSPEASARLIGSARTILLHGLSSPERFTEAAGSRLIESTTRQIERDRFTGFGSSRLDREPRVDPDEVRRLRPGQCFAIGAGLALKLQIAPIPRSEHTPTDGAVTTDDAVGLVARQGIRESASTWAGRTTVK
jgi:hypothetical protein